MLLQWRLAERSSYLVMDKAGRERFRVEVTRLLILPETDKTYPFACRPRSRSGGHPEPLNPLLAKLFAKGPIEVRR